jgi:hypothetical protein
MLIFQWTDLKAEVSNISLKGNVDAALSLIRMAVAIYDSQKFEQPEVKTLF